MSRLSRILETELKRLTGQKINYLNSFMNWWDDNYFVSRCRDYYYYPIKAFLRNLPMFVRFAWYYRSWDYTYNLSILADLLEDTAKNLRKYGNAVDSEKSARRAFTAAGLIRKAYMEHNVNKTLIYLFKKCPVRIRNRTLDREQNIPEHIYEGMYNSARRREDKAEKELKEQTWAYIHKYIENFWD